MYVYASLGLFWLVEFFKSNHAGKYSFLGKTENQEHMTTSKKYYREQAGLWM